LELLSIEFLSIENKRAKKCSFETRDEWQLSSQKYENVFAVTSCQLDEPRTVDKHSFQPLLD
jgi:hypothetical protein